MSRIYYPLIVELSSSLKSEGNIEKQNKNKIVINIK